MNKLEIKNIDIQAKDGDTRLVSGASLSVGEGEIVLLMGQNGSGKSSLLNGIMGHPGYVITSGDVVIDGESVVALSPEEKARRGLFLSPQNPPALDGVALSQFLYATHKALGGSMDMLSFYTYAEEAARAISVPEDFLKRSVNDGLSGGEKKMSELLQLAILNPRYALLDEIDSGVDRDSVQRITKTIQSYTAKKRGFLLVTHYDRILDLLEPDAVHIMYNGKIVRSGGKELVREIKEKGYTKLMCKNT